MDKNFLIKIINHYGISNQLGIAQEELAELIQAISKFKRGKEGASKDIIEEVADVTIMLEQIKIAFNITDEILNDEIDCKLDRMRKRMEKKCERQI